MTESTVARPRPPVGRLARWCLPSFPILLYPPPPGIAPLTTSSFAVGAAAFAWGLLIGVAAGAAAGTVIVPVFGTIYGAFIGPLVAVLPAIVGAVAVGAVVRHQPLPLSPERLALDLCRLFAGIVAVLLIVVGIVATLIAVYGVEDTDPLTFVAVTIWGLAATGAATAATVAILRPATRALTRRVAIAHGWR